MLKNSPIGNPFYKSTTDNICATWIIENRNLVAGKVSKFLFGRGYGSQHVDEAIDYLVNYFIENPQNDFDVDFFEGEYEVKVYTLKRITFELMTFANKLKAEKNDLYLHNTDESDTYMPRTISYDKVVKQDDLEMSMASVEAIVDYTEYSAMLNMDIACYQEDFKNMYEGFDIRNFVKVVFLSQHEGDSETMAEHLGLTTTKFGKALKNFKTTVAQNGEDFKDLYQTILSLVKAVDNGWVPVVA